MWPGLAEPMRSARVASCPPRPIAVEHLEVIRRELPLTQLGHDLLFGHVGAPGNLLHLVAYRAGPHDLVERDPRVVLVFAVAVLEEERRLDFFDADLLGQLAARSLLVGLARTYHPPDHHVVHVREHVLRRGASMDVDVAAGVPDDDRHAPVGQVPRADLAAGSGSDHPIVVVDQDADLFTLRLGIRPNSRPHTPHLRLGTIPQFWGLPGSPTLALASAGGGDGARSRGGRDRRPRSLGRARQAGG